MTRVIITAPCQVEGKAKDIGDKAEVRHDGELRRLLHFGQAAVAEPETTDKTTPRTSKEK
ncbi:hypothetical protein [Actinomyces faecalis]|uniref:hypothetical protein n=1 Tax=Actinomyces faecalis TaxID=2722820 RepID=UPI0015517778|nr:hypothetical protein [Actinomyces faecalis]